MKNLYNLNPKSYKEGFDILRLLPEDKQNKIPKSIWDFLETHMDLKHKITSDDMEQNHLLNDTNLLLAIIFKAYLATKEEKAIILAKELSVKRKKEKIANEKYNPNDLFKKNS